MDNPEAGVNVTRPPPRLSATLLPASDPLRTPVNPRSVAILALATLLAAAAALYFPLSGWELSGLLLFGGGLPLMAVLQRGAMDEVMVEMERSRIPIYLASGFTILLMGGIALFLTLPAGAVTDPGELGFTLPPLGLFVGWTLGTTLAGVVVVLLFRPLVSRWGGENTDFLRLLFPKTSGERRLFVGLSMAAGFGEELAYRGYFWILLQALGMGPWSAALIAAIPFGLLHAYQGPMGVLRTGTMGFFLALPVIATGSLIPSIVAHTLLDLILGIFLGDRLLTPSGTDADPPSSTRHPPSEPGGSIHGD